MNRIAKLIFFGMLSLLACSSEADAGYIDGMSQYRGYFVPQATDPSGSNTFEFHGCGANAVNAQGERTSVYTSYPTADDFPIQEVYTDTALDRWWDPITKTGVKALNNVCYRIDADCKNGIAEVRGIEFKLFITIPTTRKLDRGVYGHELEHQKQITIGINNALDSFSGGIENYLCELNKKCDCDEFNKGLALAHLNIWKTIGPFYRHGGVDGGPGPLQGKPVLPFYPDGTPIEVPGNINPRPKSPSHFDDDGWICPMDDVLKGLGQFPDWQFGSRPDSTHPTPVN